MNNLKLALVEEINMLLLDNEINLSTKEKFKIAVDIIENEDSLWEELNNIILDKIKKLKKECE